MLFCTDALLRKSDANAEKTTLSLTTMQTSNRAIECSRLNLEVSNLSDYNVIGLFIVYSMRLFPYHPTLLVQKRTGAGGHT